MKLEMNAADLRVLAEEGLLNELIMKCTMGTPEEIKTEEKPKKATKKTTKKKEEPKVEPEPKPEEPKADSATPAEVPQEAPVETVAPPVEPQFNPDMLAQKAISLMDKGKAEELQALLAQFGVSCLPELQPEQYAAFHQALVDMEA